MVELGIILVTFSNHIFQPMAANDPRYATKNLISRREMLGNSMLAGLGLAAGFYLTNPDVTHVKAKKSKTGNKNDLKNKESEPEEETYIDNFDC